MAKRYRVTLTSEERDALDWVISRGKADARRLAHARVPLQADASEAGPGWAEAAIVEALRVSARKRDGAQEAKLIALACSDPPDGKARWTVRLLRSGEAVCVRPSRGWPWGLCLT